MVFEYGNLATVTEEHCESVVLLLRQNLPLTPSVFKNQTLNAT